MSKELTRTAYLSNLYLAASGSAMIPLCTRAQEMADHDAAQRATIQQLRDEQTVARHIEGSFWAALKLLNLTHLDVQNPGRHFTEHIQQLEAQVKALQRERQPISLARHQPCGCIICTCGDVERCHGCGAKNCGQHAVGAMPDPLYVSLPRFRAVFCSQCGGEFGPGDHGYSHCRDHQRPPLDPAPDSTVEREGKC